MATHEEKQKTLLNDNQWQNWQNNSLAKKIKQAQGGAMLKNAVAKQDYVNKLKSKNTAIRPYYYQQGSQYGLDKNAIDRLFGYDNGTGRVSFDGEDWESPLWKITEHRIGMRHISATSGMILSRETDSIKSGQSHRTIQR